MLKMFVSAIISGYVVYCKQGKFCWAKLSQYPQYMDFHGNSFAVQGQGAYILRMLRTKDS